MGLFIKRPLALASLEMMAFCALGMLLAPKPMQFAIVALATVALLLLVWFFRARRKFSYTRFLLLLIAVFSLVGGVRGFFEARAIKRLTEHRIGQTVKVEMSILETRYTGSYASEFLAELHFVDGEDIGGKAVLKCSYALPFYEGDRLRGNFRMESRDFDDPNQTNRANGVRAVLVSESDDSLFYISRKSSPFDSFKTLQSRLSHSLRTVIGGEEVKTE